jgi:poly(3-hydroxybutyrate) depolymerase
MTAPGGVQNRTIQVAGAERTYVLSIPENYDSTQATPLVFAWHGLGGDGELARLYFGVEREADGAAIFVYADGLPNEEGKAAWDLAPDGSDVALFDALLASLTAEYCVDASRVFATGHSYGGFMTNRLACSRGDVLRAVAPVAGGPPFGGGSSTECAGEVAAFLVHGTYDPTVDIEQGQAALTRYTSANGCLTSSVDVTPAPCVSYDGCTGDLAVTWCEHDTPEEDAHNWPDFAAEGIWAFFSALQ